MSRTLPLLSVCCILGLSTVAVAQTPTADKPTDSMPPPPTASGVMQIKKLITGEFSYRFVAPSDKPGAAPTAPVPLPTPPAADNIVAVPVPSGADVKGAAIEILDNSRGNIARLPISKSSVAQLGESSFTLAQRVGVPVQSKGLGVIGAQVAMSTASKKYTQTRLLQADDSGIARFDAVPLNEPVTVTVSYGSNPPESQTKTLTAARPPDAWPAIVVTWPDIKTVPAPATTAPPSSSGPAAHSTDRSPRASDDESRDARQSGTNPLNSLVSTVISLLFLAAVGYAVFWAYKTGRLKTMLDRLGINTDQTVAGGATIPDPFSKENKTPIQPITEGTADPFVGAGVSGVNVAPPVSNGPRLVATAGAYSGAIFPLAAATADIGRDAGNAVPLPNDTNASRRHATIQNANGQYTLVDNASSNGTFVNGVRVPSQTPQPLRAGDEVQIGLTRFRFEA